MRSVAAFVALLVVLLGVAGGVRAEGNVASNGTTNAYRWSCLAPPPPTYSSAVIACQANVSSAQSVAAYCPMTGGSVTNTSTFALGALIESGPTSAAYWMTRSYTDACTPANSYSNAQYYRMNAQAYATTVPTCPSNASLVGGGCVCDGSFVPNGGATACVSSCSSQAGSTVRSGSFDIGTNPSARPTILACSAGCESVFDGVSPSGSALVGGVKHYFARGTYVATGNPCTTAAGVDPPSVGDNTPPSTCAAGQSAGTVNGRRVCVASSANPASGPASPTATATTVKGPSASDGAGGSTQTTVTTATAADGSVTTTTVTTATAADGSVTTTTLITGAGPANDTDSDGGRDTDVNRNGIPDAAEGGASAPSSAASAAPSANPCTDNPSGAGCGGAAAASTARYTAKSRTFAQVFADRQSQWSTSPLVSGVAAFFTVPTGASCPTFVLTLAYFQKSYAIDQFCSSTANTMLAVVYAAVLMVCGFFGFRVAFL